MNGFPIRKTFGAAIAVVVLAACGGTGAPSLAGPAMQAPSLASDAQIVNVGGQYSGTISDSEFGKAKATIDLAQYKSAAGGTFTIVKGTTKHSAPGTYVVSGTTLSGTGVAQGSPHACLFVESAKYNATTHVLSGSYRAPHGCSGDAESGTYTLKQQCYYARDWAARPENGLKQC